MTQFPKPVHQRAASGASTLQRRVQVLEQRLNASCIPQAGVISPSYASGNPMVTVGTDTAPSGPYQYLSSYGPAASDAVALLWLGGTWVVLGKLQ